MAEDQTVKVLRFEISTILVGLALAKATDVAISKQAGFHVTLLIIYFFINTINFFHAKLAISLDDRYRELIKHHYVISLAESYLTIMLWISFLFQSFFVDNLIVFLYCIIVIRAIDTVLVAYDFYVDRFVLAIKSAHNIQRLYWVGFNLLNAFASALLLCIFSHRPPSDGVVGYVSIGFILSVIADIFIDYRIGRHLYHTENAYEPATNAPADKAS